MTDSIDQMEQLVHPVPEALPLVTEELNQVKRRGRSKGSKNRPKQQQQDDTLPLLAAAFDGTFDALSLMLGDHWRLTPLTGSDGQQIRPGLVLAQAWKPILDHYQTDPTVSLLWCAAITSTLGIVAPRVVVSIKERKGLIGRVIEWWRQRKRAQKNR